MATQAFTKALLSGSTNGKGIKVTGTSTAGTVTLHTAVSGTSSMDEIWLYCRNNHTVPVTVTLEWGSSSTDDNIIWTSLPIKTGRILLVDGALLQNSLTVKAFASVANVTFIEGFVNQIV